MARVAVDFWLGHGASEAAGSTAILPERGDTAQAKKQRNPKGERGWGRLPELLVGHGVDATRSLLAPPPASPSDARAGHASISAGSFARRTRWLFLLLSSLLATAATSRAAEVMPPVPPRYFNDYTLSVSGPVVEELNQQLADFERQTSSQIVVAVFRKAETDSSIQDYSHRIFQSWKVGRPGVNNGAVVFVYLDNRKIWIEVGYGLEGAIPDGTAKQIIDTVITPRFKANDFDGGLRAGVSALIAAAQGEYKGTGKTTAEERRRGGPNQGIPLWVIIVIIILIFVIASGFRDSGQGRVYDSRGYRNVRTGPIFWGGGFGGGFGGGGGGSSGGGGGFGGGGFSGGGGSSGGGGAGGDW